MALSLLTLAVSGCRSAGKPGSASFASVVIADKSDAEIRHATTAVFVEAGYLGFTGADGELVFEKEGTRKNQIAHGGWIATEHGNETWVRVRARIVDVGGGAHRLQCQAFMVPHHGDSFFEEEKRLANFRGGPYQELMDQVAARLK